MKREINIIKDDQNAQTVLIRDSVEVGKRLRELRNHFELKQEEFADRIKIHQSSVALFEGGKRFLKDLYIKMICDEFGCQEDWLLYGVGDMFKTPSMITIEEYAEKYDLTPVEQDIVLNFMELNDKISEQTRRESLDTFVRSLAESKKEFMRQYF